MRGGAAQDDPVAEPSGTERSVKSRGDSARDSVITDTSAVKIIRHTEGQPLAKAVHEAFQDPEPRRRFFAWFRALGVDGEQRLLASVRKLNAMYVAADVIDKGLGPLLENGAVRAEHVITVEYGPKLSRGAAQALETRAAYNVGGKEWCELAACNRLMEVARVAPGDARIAPKVEPDDAVSLASHVDPPLVTSHARGKRAAEGEPEPDSAPAAKLQVVVWRIFECGHRFTDETYQALMRSSGLGGQVHCPTCRAPAGRTIVFERSGALVVRP